jgi:hypothetical protein
MASRMVTSSSFAYMWEAMLSQSRSRGTIAFRHPTDGSPGATRRDAQLPRAGWLHLKLELRVCQADHILQELIHPRVTCLRQRLFFWCWLEVRCRSMSRSSRRAHHVRKATVPLRASRSKRAGRCAKKAPNLTRSPTAQGPPHRNFRKCPRMSRYCGVGVWMYCDLHALLSSCNSNVSKTYGRTAARHDSQQWSNLEPACAGEAPQFGQVAQQGCDGFLNEVVCNVKPRLLLVRGNHNPHLVMCQVHNIYI